MAHQPPHSDLDLFPAFYQLLNDDMASAAGFSFPPTFDLVVPPVDAHNNIYIQQQLVGDEDDDGVEEIQGPVKGVKRAKQVTSPRESSSVTAASASSAAKVRAACSNCRSSHVACSHEIPCKRCVEHGLADSCQYLPRKKRTNFKKRKMHSIKDEEEDDDSNSNGSLVDNDAAIKMEEMRRNPPANLFEGGQPDQGLWNATLHQLFGNEYAFPLVNTNIPPQSQPKDYGLPLLPSSTSPYTVESPQSSPFAVEADNTWLSQLIGDSSPSSTSSSSAPTSPAEESQRNSAQSSPDTQQLGIMSQRSWLKNSGGMMQLAPMPTVGHSRVSQPPMIKPPSPAVAPLSPGSVSSRTVNILQEMKAKNDRLERLLRSALDDIKELKQREKLREQHNITMQSLVQLQNIGPADEFRKGVPALAMFALSEERHGAVLQANETFRDLVGYSFDQLATPGFTCCQLFPERFKSKLCKDYKDIMSGLKSSGQDDLVIRRGDLQEVPVRAFYHVIYDDVGRPLYKMFYAFPLA